MSAAGSGSGQRAGDGPGGANSSHRALLYRQPQELARAAGAFVREGLTAGEPVLAVLPGEKLDRARSEVGNASSVEFVNATVFYRHHGRAARFLIDWLCAHARDPGRARVITEPPLAGQAAAQVADYLRTEAAANLFYSQFAVSVLCPYDASALPEDVLADAQRTHPELVRDGRVAASALFADPRDFVRERSQVPGPPPSAPSLAIDDAADLATARSFLRRHAAAAGLGRETIAYLVIAAGELITNALIHGRPPRRLSVYPVSPMLICHIHDSGPGLADPLTAYLVPDSHAPRGHGLWLARQLCDRLDIASSQAGTHIRLGVDLPARQNHDGQPPQP